MNQMRYKLLTVVITVTLLAGCKEEDEVPNGFDEIITLPATPYAYTQIDLPDHLTTNVLIGAGQNAATDNDNTPANNPITDHGATLGRVLFYDKQLSQNGTISCASCHKQSLGFSDDAVLSKGFDGGRPGASPCR